jgi:serine/threonine-protein kinase RsbT
MIETIAIRNEIHAVIAAHRARSMARQLGFSIEDQVALSNTIMEVARNLSKNAGTGEVTLETIDDNGHIGIRVTAQDCGSGISDGNRTLSDGNSIDRALGPGPVSARRLSSAFEIDSAPGKGMVIRLIKWKSA